jgi:hypothetical protein
MLEHHPVRYPAAMAAQGVTRIKLRGLTTAALSKQRTELDPGRLQQA